MIAESGMKTKWPEGALTLEDCTFCEGLIPPSHFSYSISYCTCVVLYAGAICLQPAPPRHTWCGPPCPAEGV